jgi:hypothetical protein
MLTRMGTLGKATGRTWSRSVLLSLLLPVAAYAQSDTAWLFRYPGTGQGDYQPLASFVDDTGNVYVAGWAQAEGDSPDALLLKIDSLGHLVWARTYDNVTAEGAAVDANGTIYIAGGTSDSTAEGRIHLLKYKPNGDLEWVRTFGEQGKNYAAFGSIAIVTARMSTPAAGRSQDPVPSFVS